MQVNDELTDTNSKETSPKPRRKSRAFATKLKRGNNMCSGIGEHLETLSPKGLSNKTIREIERLVKNCEKLHSQREILKGELKTKTAELNEETEKLDKALGFYGMIIKAVIPKVRWVDFGITAKR